MICQGGGLRFCVARTKGVRLSAESETVPLCELKIKLLLKLKLKEATVSPVLMFLSCC